MPRLGKYYHKKKGEKAKNPVDSLIMVDASPKSLPNRRSQNKKGGCFEK